MCIRDRVKSKIPDFNVGDTVKVQVRVTEGGKERIQAYEGIVIAKRHNSVRETFTVRKISHGVGVERTFPINSPKVANVEVLRKGLVQMCIRDRFMRS